MKIVQHTATQSQITPQHSTFQEPTGAAQTPELGSSALYTIFEVDNNDIFHPPPEISNFFTNIQEGAKKFLSALGNSTMLESESENKSEDYGLDLDAISSMTNGDLGFKSSGTDDAFLQSSLPLLPPSPPPPAKRKGKAKSITGTSSV
ncbi:hypothetical protein J3R83DRAFT_5877 [Lanmaoa asiatica]|nr:hypothetical protein J3R83DRAFT_5877 [Lanmaoa asiatica]